MLYAFAHRHDGRIGRYHVIVDQDAAFDVQPGAAVKIRLLFKTSDQQAIL